MIVLPSLSSLLVKASFNVLNGLASLPSPSGDAESLTYHVSVFGFCKISLFSTALVSLATALSKL